jgi:hypothetical protein
MLGYPISAACSRTDGPGTASDLTTAEASMGSPADAMLFLKVAFCMARFIACAPPPEIHPSLHLPSALVDFARETDTYLGNLAFIVNNSHFQSYSCLIHDSTRLIHLRILQKSAASCLTTSSDSSQVLTFYGTSHLCELCN